MATIGRRPKDPPDIAALIHAPRFAFVVGINRYAHQPWALTGATEDALAVARLLREHFHYPDDDVLVLLDEQATRSGMIEGFRALREKIRAAKNARVVVYFAGHGMATTDLEQVKSDTPGYFIPQDARPGAQDTYLSMRFVETKFEALACHHLLLVLDCCFAGAFRWSATRAAGGPPGVLYKERFERFLRDPAWYVITSAAADERASDTLNGKVMLAGVRDQPARDDNTLGARSPFTVALIEGLKSGDADSKVLDKRGDGVITASELHLYIEQRFADWQALEGRNLQKPLLFPWPGNEKNKGEFVFFDPHGPRRLRSAIPLVRENNPYRGFAAYGTDDAEMFFGRDALTAALAKKFLDADPGPFFILGASGSGKTSLVAAGLLPQLAKAGWTHAVVSHPGHKPEEALAAARKTLDAVSGAQRVLVVDQLEELAGRDEPSLFAGVRRLTDELPGLRILYLLRSDAEHRFQDLLGSSDPVKNRMRVPSMSREELRAVIEGPAEACVFRFDPTALVDDIVEEIADAPGALPLLSFTLRELYLCYVQAVERGGRSDRSLTRADYQQLGGVTSCLAAQADRVYTGQSAAAQATMRRVMLRMVSLDTGRLARREVLRSELHYAAEQENERVGQVLGALVAARLIVVHDDIEDGIDLCHVAPADDRLILNWSTLRAWLDDPEEKARLAALRVVSARVPDWLRLGRAGSLLHDDPRLDGWLAMLKGPANPFNADEAALLRASEKRRAEEEAAEAEQKARRRRLITGSLSALGVILTVAAIVSISLYLRAEERAGQLKITSDELATSRDAFVVKAEEAAASARRAEERARVARDASRVAAAQRNAADDRVALALGLLREVESASPGADVKGWSLEVSQALAKPGRELMVLRGHTDRVQSGGFSKDGSRVLTASQDGTARIWDARTGAELRVFQTESPVESAEFSPDERRVLTLNRWASRTTPQIWDVETATLLKSFPQYGSAVYDASGTRILTTPHDGRPPVAQILDAETGDLLVTFEGARRAVFSPDGAAVVTAGDDTEAHVWDARTGEKRATLRGHQQSVASMAFSPDGARIVTAADGESARIWDARTGRQKKVLSFAEGEPPTEVHDVTFRPDGQHVLLLYDRVMGICCDPKLGSWLRIPVAGMWIQAASYNRAGTQIVTVERDDNLALVWDTADTRTFTAELRGHERPLTSATFSPDGARILTTAYDGTARIWQVEGRAELAALAGRELASATFSPDGRRILTVASGGVGIWDVATRTELVRLPSDDSGVPAPDSDIVFGVPAPDWTRVAVASKSGPLRLWDMTADSRPTVLAAEGPFLSVKFSPDGRRIAALAANWTVWLGDGSGNQIAAHAGPAGLEPDPMFERYALLDFSPDGKRLTAAAGGPAIQILDVERGERVATLTRAGEVAGYRAIAYDREGTHLFAVSTDWNLQIWDLRTGRETDRPPMPGVRSVDFSPDGRRVLTLEQSNNARIWDVGMAAPQVELPKEGYTFWAGFSPDGTRVLTENDDAMRLWDTNTGAELNAFLDDGVILPRSAAFSPDGTRVATVHDDVVRLWWTGAPGDDIPAMRMLWHATARCPTPEDRMQLLGDPRAAAEAATRACEAMVRCIDGHADDDPHFAACLDEFRRSQADQPAPPPPADTPR